MILVIVIPPRSYFLDTFMGLGLTLLWDRLVTLRLGHSCHSDMFVRSVSPLSSIFTGPLWMIYEMERRDFEASSQDIDGFISRKLSAWSSKKYVKKNIFACFYLQTDEIGRSFEPNAIARL